MVTTYPVPKVCPKCHHSWPDYAYIGSYQTGPLTVVTCYVCLVFCTNRSERIYSLREPIESLLEKDTD